jgi:hypothetical protein
MRSKQAKRRNDVCGFGALAWPVSPIKTGVTKRSSGTLTCLRLLFPIGLIVLLSCSSVLLLAQERARVDSRKVEAAFLRNFAHYITWPVEAFADPQEPWRICVLGTDPFGDVLEQTFEGRTEQGRSFTILRTQNTAGLQQCQIVYVGFKVSAYRRAALIDLKGRPVLTVSNAPGFLQEGGIIRFEVGDYVKLSVNLDHARAASLSIQTKVLEVSSAVIENGVVRQVR